MIVLKTTLWIAAIFFAAIGMLCPMQPRLNKGVSDETRLLAGANFTLYAIFLVLCLLWIGCGDSHADTEPECRDILEITKLDLQVCRAKLAAEGVE